MQTIHKSGITMVSDERMRDSLIDLHNYAAMAIMLLDEDEATSCENQVLIAEAGVGLLKYDNVGK